MLMYQSGALVGSAACRNLDHGTGDDDLGDDIDVHGSVSFDVSAAAPRSAKKGVL